MLDNTVFIDKDLVVGVAFSMLRLTSNKGDNITITINCQVGEDELLDAIRTGLSYSIFSLGAHI